MTDFRAFGQRLSNWGRWGADDRIGTLNHITQERLAAAGKLIRKGKLFELSMPIGSNGVQVGLGGRTNPIHHMSMLLTDSNVEINDIRFSDDWVTMPLQSSTQWDGLGHVGYDDRIYNDLSYHTVDCSHGSSELKIGQILEKGIAGRGVLLDIAALHGVDSLKAGQAISPAELEAAEARQGVRVGAGDILLIRTGWIQRITRDRSPIAYWTGAPGIDLYATDWLHAREVAAVASDNWGVEVVSSDMSAIALPVHGVLIRDMGMTLGEIFHLEDLATDCARDGVYEFFFSGSPLKIDYAVGSPVTPMAFK